MGERAMGERALRGGRPRQGSVEGHGQQEVQKVQDLLSSNRGRLLQGIIPKIGIGKGKRERKKGLIRVVWVMRLCVWVIFIKGGSYDDES